MMLDLGELQGATFRIEGDLRRVKEDVAQIRRFADAAADSDLLPPADLSALGVRCRPRSACLARTS